MIQMPEAAMANMKFRTVGERETVTETVLQNSFSAALHSVQGGSFTFNF